MNHILACPDCSEVIMKTSDEETKIRGKMLIFKSSKAYIVCRGCGAELPVPLTLDKSQVVEKNPALILEKHIDNKKILK